jgi:hypothetical protein
MSEFYGVFSNYEIEDVYNFIGKHKIEKRLKELENVPTMGTTLIDFISRDIRYHGIGVIEVFNMILEYFPNDFDLAYFLYNKSKEYDEGNYFSSEKQKNEREKYIESIKMMINRGEDVEYFKAKLNSPFWLELHFFYMNLMKLFVTKQKEKQLLKFKIEGIYLVEKNKMTKDDIILEIKKRRSPGVGNYLSVKSAPELHKVWFDLELITNTNDIQYQFKKNSCIYILKLTLNDAIIEKTSDNTTNDELKLVNTEIEIVVRDVVNNYIKNFESISNVVFMDFGQRLANGFVSFASNYLDEQDELMASLIQLNNKFNKTWLTY